MVGGSVSLFIRAAVIAYVLIVFIRLATYGDTREMATYTHIDFHHQHDKEFKTWHDSHMTLVVGVKKYLSEPSELSYEKFHKYLKVHMM